MKNAVSNFEAAFLFRIYFGHSPPSQVRLSLLAFFSGEKAVKKCSNN